MTAASSARALPAADDLDAHLLMPSEVMKKMKHKQKQIVLEKAVDSVADALASTSNIPLCKRMTRQCAHSHLLTFDLSCC